MPHKTSWKSVFGSGGGSTPPRPKAWAKRTGGRDFLVCAEEQPDVLGYTVLWGYRPDKLYHSCMVMGGRIAQKRIGALVKGQVVFVRVDAFNENGITHGEILRL